MLKKHFRGKEYNYKNEQERWDEMTTACINASVEELGYVERKK